MKPTFLEKSGSLFQVKDFRGLAQLVTQATHSVAQITEGVHQSVWSTLGVPGGATPGQTRGVTGLIYRSIHGITRLAGQGVDAALANLQPLLESTKDTKPDIARREAVLAALNGVIGDHLLATDNPLAIPMTLRYQGEATGKVLLLIHGLCMTDTVATGETLASALGYTPVYLRYNSGLHTSQNGRELSAQLERLITCWPTPIEEFAVVAHSMGGLLARSAFHYAKEEGLCWPDHLKNMIFLGTPHHGAPLERAGNWIDVLLGSMPYTAPFARLGHLRSAGITDLRHGHVLDEDWQGHDRFQPKSDERRIVPLPKGVACFAVAATTAAKRGVLADRWIGDGLVPLRSALGQHDDARRKLDFAPTSQWIAYDMGHIEMLSNPEVTRRMVQWLTHRC